MSVETDLQRDIKKSVIKQGGYCIKLSNRFTIGVPDLLIALPPFAPCYVEVKKLGPCIANFQRKLDVSPKQRHELNSFTDVYGSDIIRLSFLFIGLEWADEHFLVGLPRTATYLSGPTMPAFIARRQLGNSYDIKRLLGSLNATRLNT